MPHRFIARRLKRFFIYRVLHIDDTPHRIALGVAIGIFVTWTPTIGFQMILTVALSTLFKANKFVGVPFVWISNPFTLIPLYGPSYLLGGEILGGHYKWSAFMQACRKAMSAHNGWITKIQAWWTATSSILLPIWLGSIITGLIAALLTYILIHWAVVKYRKHWHRHHKPKTQ